jgi:hypothetical protein
MVVELSPLRNLKSFKKNTVTAIQDDLIRDKSGKIVDHPELHIALKLNDEGPEGKLFLMDY